jgi:hypothetical protein
MKRLIFTFIIITVIFGLGIYSIVYTNSMAKDMIVSLNKSIMLVEKNQLKEAKDQANVIIKKWNFYEKKLFLYIRKNEIDETSRIINELEIYLKYNHTAQYCIEANKAITLIKELQKSEQATLKNMI